MLDLSPDKILMLGVVALIVLGPNRLPQAARTVGRFIGQMRSMTASLQTEVRDALHDPNDAFVSAIAEFRPPDVRRAVRQAVTDTLAPPTAAAVAPTTNGVNSAAEIISGPPALQTPATPGWPATPDDPAFN